MDDNSTQAQTRGMTAQVTDTDKMDDTTQTQTSINTECKSLQHDMTDDLIVAGTEWDNKTFECKLFLLNLKIKNIMCAT
jgi:hypothetical protein